MTEQIKTQVTSLILTSMNDFCSSEQHSSRRLALSKSVQWKKRLIKTEGDVTSVYGQTEPSRKSTLPYAVWIRHNNAYCACIDYHRHHGAWCKHLISLAITALNTTQPRQDGTSW